VRKSLFLVVFVAAGCGVFPSGSEPPPVVTSETPRPIATQAITTDPPSATPEPSTRILVVKVTKQSASAKQNDTATITIKTKKNSRCNIDVEYESGQATAAGLGNKTADSSGTITWKWTVGANTIPGVWPIHIACQLKDRSGDVETTLRVK
jgi:hypothetical protein